MVERKLLDQARKEGRKEFYMGEAWHRNEELKIHKVLKIT